MSSIPDFVDTEHRFGVMSLSMFDLQVQGNWTTRGLPTRGLADAAKRTKTKHAKSPVASASCSVAQCSS